MMRSNYIICDYSGHPFQIQLSRELARRGSSTTHIYCDSFTTPKGNIESANSNLNIVPIKLNERVNKSNFLKRRAADIEFGLKLNKLIESLTPTIVVLSNMPLDSLRLTTKFLIKNNIPFVYWLQDIYSVAMRNILPRKLPVIGHLIASYYKSIEVKALKKSSHIVCITDDFVDILSNWDISSDKCSVIANWAPIDELPLMPKDNEWSRMHGFENKKIILYSGTLGHKHNPELLLKLGKTLEDYSETKLLIISEGEVVDKLISKVKESGMNTVDFLPFQKFSELPNVLGASDILIGILEKEAGIFSVPSKVLTYLTSRKPIVLSVPLQNLASKIILKNKCGLVCAPAETEAFLTNVKQLIENDELRSELGNNAREYAEETFSISEICDKFQKILFKNNR